MPLNNTKLLESLFQYHRLAFQEPETVPHQELETAPNMGKHRAKQELETVPPQEVGTVPPKGAKNDPSGGTVSNSPVVLFLTLDLLVAAVEMIFFKGDTVSNS